MNSNLNNWKKKQKRALEAKEENPLEENLRKDTRSHKMRYYEYSISCKEFTTFPSLLFVS